MEVVNVMVVSKLLRSGGEQLDLTRMVHEMSNIEYRPQRFAPVIVRTRRPIRASFLIYSSGSVICTGTKSEEEAKKACRCLLKKVRGVYPDCRIYDFKVTNMVGSTKLGFALDLEQISNNCSRCLFNPELFPGMFFRPSNLPGVTATLFRSGKVNITGALSRDQLSDALEEVVSVVL